MNDLRGTASSLMRTSDDSRKCKPQLVHFELLVESSTLDVCEYGDRRWVTSVKFGLDIIIFALIKWSALISVGQAIFLGALLTKFGSVSPNENPYMGPSILVLITYGAKDAELIIEKYEYWRLLSAIMIHAGVYHLSTNITMQLLISGYLEHIWGARVFFTIYFSCGIVGYLCSCCFLYNSVSVGSSGSIMGLLASWLVDITFNLQEMRSEETLDVLMIHSQRVMLYSVATAIFLTLATSGNSGVDWASHAGGCVYGAIWACVLFQVKIKKDAIMLRIIALSSSDEAQIRKSMLCQRMIKILCMSLLLTMPVTLCAYMVGKKITT